MLFGQDSTEDGGSLKSFGDKPKAGDLSQGGRGVFGAPSLTQQLQVMQDMEQRPIRDLAKAFEQAGISAMQA
ncbi:hypothetical protein TRE132_01730 [Pseudomonas chlororaphis subsp. aurantiaca]|nr:hypothetical protein TRE132_01730 [Pseudomonas chlororaphis subsp. aurantiaca]